MQILVLDMLDHLLVPNFLTPRFPIFQDSTEKPLMQANIFPNFL